MKVKSIKSLEKQQVYNLSVASECHNYVLANGTVSKNSASYAMVSYVTSFLKFNYPAEYMAALLSTTKNKDEAALYLNECRNMGIEVLPPSINKSFADFNVESDDTVLFGLSRINGIGPAVVHSIMEGRTEKEYETLYDFMRRCSPELLNKGILEHLSYSGALDELVSHQESIPLSRDFRMDILEAEKNELGLYITENPLLGVWHVIESSLSCSIRDLENRRDGEVVTVGGILTNVQPKLTRRGDKMFILSLQDLTSSIEILVFPKNIKDYEFNEGDIVTVSGRLSQEGDDDRTISKLFFTHMTKPEIPQFGSGTPIILELTNKPDYDTVKRMKTLIENHPGDCPVFINFKDRHIDVSLKFKRPVNDSVREELKTITKSFTSIV